MHGSQQEVLAEDDDVMNAQPYDLIGDIHGHFDKLVGLLAHLGYRPAGASWKHPEGRKVIFLGDYIDRGPKVREVLHTVRGMVDAGDALAIMGNHEYNAVCYHEPDGKGGWLRAHHWDRDSGLRVSLAQFADRKAEWQDWLRWMRQLPLFLDLGDLRVVHACWDAEGVTALRGKSLLDEALLHASVVRSSPEFRAVDRLLKGPELAMPKGYFFHDKNGTVRRKVRVRWWNLPEQARLSHLALPVPFDVPGEAKPAALSQLPNYGPDEPPVFLGHYWLPADHARAPLAANIACLDYSAAHEGPLMAYRWEGEQKLCASKFVCAA